MKNRSFIALFLWGVCLSCVGDEQELESNCNCPSDMGCTKQLETVVITVTDNSGKPYPLDSFRTVQSRTGEVYRLTGGLGNDWAKENGIYPVISDNSLSKISPCGEEFIFEGYHGETKVVNHPLSIKSNCCHVEWLAGNLKITVK